MPDDFAGADAIVEGLDDGCFSTVIGRSPIGIGSTIDIEVYAGLSEYRVSGGTYFFTVNLLDRRLDTLVPHIDALREAVRVTGWEGPFHIDAWVVLSGHLHWEARDP